jgi:hypothetical protein
LFVSLTEYPLNSALNVGITPLALVVYIKKSNGLIILQPEGTEKYTVAYISFLSSLPVGSDEIAV